MEKITDEQLWQWVAGEAPEAEAARLEQAMCEDESIQKRTAHIRLLHQTLQRQATLEEPSSRFTARTMAALREKPLLPMTYGKGFLILGGIVVATGLAAMLMAFGIFDSEAAPLTLRQPWLTRLIGSPTLHFEVKTVVKAVMLGNLALALVLLDRTILRPYFQRRSLSR
ncbi:MAG: hypothetical protein MUC38_09820 [Cyclobacteriaceae bacterium]|jgi:hypothetical protein|nr:hypothetical protein [Cyclobacteriaceae bacterium]